MKKYEFPLMFYIVKTLRAMLKGLRIVKEGSALDHKLNASFCNQIWSFMKKDFSDIIKDYSGREDFKAGKNGGRIWMCWWQGEVNAPPLVKMCIDSVRRNAVSHEVVVIDKNSLTDYVEMPAHILEKHEAGIIRTVSFTDILRVYLLAEYGGLWLDATVYCIKPIPEKIWSMPLFTLKYYGGHFTRLQTEIGTKDLSFADNIIGGMSRHPLFYFSRDMLAQYWEKYSSLIVYGVLFFIIQLAYDTIPLVRQDINTLPVTTDNRRLDQIFNDAYSQEKIGVLKASDTVFFKLYWNKEYREYTDAGEETVYRKFMEGLI